ncbi:MAG: hypothetical protein GYB66_15290 [Chloroflexi bacterium]|nr:hypothetical protein [Chloroflexota bacterium]
MDDLYQKLVDQRRGMAWLIGKMPGFRGYMEHTTRRTADRLLRDHIASQFKQLMNEYVNLETKLLKAGGLAYMSDTKSAKTKFQTLIDRIATDAPGYSGFFAANKITPDDLEAIYTFDEAMIRYTEEIAEALTELSNAIQTQEGIPAALDHLDSLMVEANQAYDLRDDVIKGIA